MLLNCANPACSVPLRYLRDGRLYQFEVKTMSASSYPTHAWGEKPSRRVWHYWLCGQCCVTMTLSFDRTEGLKLIPVHHHAAQPRPQDYSVPA